MRYPTRGGLAVPVLELGFEPAIHERRKTNSHHLYFDRAWYQDKRIRQVFRNLVPHVQTLWIPDHAALHEKFSAPIMLRDALMIDVVDEYLALHGVIDCVRESRTHETYQLNVEQWSAICQNDMQRTVRGRVA